VDGGPGTAWLAADAIWLTLVESAPINPKEGELTPAGPQTAAGLQTAANVKLSFIGANPQPTLEPFAPVDTAVHFYKGNDPDQWHTFVPVWAGVRYQDLYPGVDLVVASQNGRWAWQLVADDAAQLAQVKLSVAGAESVDVKSGGLWLQTAVGQIALPLITADFGGETAVTPLAAHQFQIQNPFAPNHPQFPRIQANFPETYYFGAYLGGSAGDSVLDMAVTGSGDLLDRTVSIYLTGWTLSSDFPTAPAGATTFSGDADVFVTKLRKVATLVRPEYSVYIGGSYANAVWGGAESGNSLVVDDSGQVYLTGATRSADFPATVGAYDTSFNGENPCGGVSPDVACTDAFVTQLGNDGVILYSTFLGGSGTAIPGTTQRVSGNDVGNGIGLSNGLVYVTGYTSAEDFPTTSGAYDRVYADVNVGLNDDVFIVKMNLAGNGSADLLYSTFIGGGLSERGMDLAVDNSGMVYVTGRAEGDIFPVNSDFPITPGAIDNYLWQGDIDAFFLKFNPAGNGAADLLYSTFLGGDGRDQGHALVIDAAGTAYVTGETGSGNFLTTNGAFDTVCGLDGTCDLLPLWGTLTDSFVSRINPAGNGVADLLYSTFLGGDKFDAFWTDGSIALGPDGDLFVTGETGSTDFPTTSGSYDEIISFSGDAYMVRLSLDGKGSADLVYSTFLGGSGWDAGRAIAVSENGDVYVAGHTYSTDFPVTQSGFDLVYGGNGDGFVSRIVPVNVTTPDVDAAISTLALVGALPGGAAVLPISYGNAGLTEASSVVITATLPVSVTYLSDTSGITPTLVNSAAYTWDLPNLAFGESGEFLLNLGTPNVAVGARYTVTLAIGSDGPEGVAGDNTAVSQIMIAHQLYLPVTLKQN